jgi:hypothetical protein
MALSLVLLFALVEHAKQNAGVTKQFERKRTMGRVSDMAIELTEEVMRELELPTDDETFDAVQAWIIDNINLSNLPSIQTIAGNFWQSKVCPQCQMIVKDHHHSCFAMERT